MPCVIPQAARPPLKNYLRNLPLKPLSPINRPESRPKASSPNRQRSPGSRKEQTSKRFPRRAWRNVRKRPDQPLPFRSCRKGFFCARHIIIPAKSGLRSRRMVSPLTTSRHTIFAGNIPRRHTGTRRRKPIVYRRAVAAN